MAYRDIAQQLLQLLAQADEGQVAQYQPQGGGQPQYPPPPQAPPPPGGVEQYMPQPVTPGRAFDAQPPPSPSGMPAQGFDRQQLEAQIRSVPDFGAQVDPRYKTVNVPGEQYPLDPAYQPDSRRIQDYISAAQLSRPPSDEELWQPFEQQAAQDKARGKKLWDESEARDTIDQATQGIRDADVSGKDSKSERKKKKWGGKIDKSIQGIRDVDLGLGGKRKWEE